MTMVTVLKAFSVGRSAKWLAGALGLAAPAGSDSHRATRGPRFVINWGCSQRPRNFAQTRLTFSNTPECVATVSNKLHTFMQLAGAGVDTLTFASRGNQMPAIRQWLEGDGKIVIRHTLRGQGGAGLEIIRRGSEIPRAPLYTRYFKKNAEYRVHVFYGRVLLIQQKRKRRGIELNDNQKLVRTFDNGWVFTMNDLDCDTKHYRESLERLALDAAAAVGINHGAVDILTRHSSRRGVAPISVVVEINSGPALEGETTRNVWRDAFVAKIQEVRND